MSAIERARLLGILSDSARDISLNLPEMRARKAIGVVDYLERALSTIADKRAELQREA